MDDARAMLDSLMGQSRNAGKEERKKKPQGDSFKQDSVCKFDLVGFCPENEELFFNTKRDLGKCSKTHYEFSRSEFNAHPDVKRYTAEYEKLLMEHLSVLCRQCDDWGMKEKRKNEERTADVAGGVAREEIKKLNEAASKRLADAEEMASAGDVKGSKAKMQEADELSKKVADWETKAGVAVEVCSICGSSKESDIAAEKASKVLHEMGRVHETVWERPAKLGFAHEMGKIHQGYVKIRDSLAELKSKFQKNKGDLGEDPAPEHREDNKRSRRGTSRSKDKERRGSGNAGSDDAPNGHTDNHSERKGSRGNTDHKEDGGKERHRKDDRYSRERRHSAHGGSRDDRSRDDRHGGRRGKSRSRERGGGGGGGYTSSSRRGGDSRRRG